jgi:hypothetical protein
MEAMHSRRLLYISGGWEGAVRNVKRQIFSLPSERSSYSRNSISGTALSGKKPISETNLVLFDSFHLQNVQCLAGFSVSGLFMRLFFSRSSKYDKQILPLSDRLSE